MMIDDDDDEEIGFDFGFTTHSETEYRKSDLEITTRFEKIRKLYLPLLDLLLKNADKEIIKWPDREKILKKAREELIRLTEI